MNASKILDVHTGVGWYTSNLCKSILETDGKDNSIHNYYFLAQLQVKICFWVICLLTFVIGGLIFRKLKPELAEFCNIHDVSTIIP